MINNLGNRGSFTSRAANAINLCGRQLLWAVTYWISSMWQLRFLDAWKLRRISQSIYTKQHEVEWTVSLIRPWSQKGHRVNWWLSLQDLQGQSGPRRAQFMYCGKGCLMSGLTWGWEWKTLGREKCHSCWKIVSANKNKQVWTGQGYSHTVNWKMPGDYECTDVAQQPSSKGGGANSPATPEKSLSLYETILLKTVCNIRD